MRGDPWKKFLFEVHRLRDYYVTEALIKQSKGSRAQFMDYKTYELEFLALLDKEYEVECPTIKIINKIIFSYHKNKLQIYKYK